MLMYLTAEVPSTASEQNNHASREQHLTIQEECRVLRQHYQSLYDDFHTLLEHAPMMQSHHLDRTAYRQRLHEHRSAMQHFRHALHAHLIRTRSFRERLTRNTPAPPSRMGKTILLGIGDAQEAAVLLEGMQQAGAHRVFVAVDWSQVQCILHNVHLDVLVLDEDLTPLPALKLSHHLRGMQGLERLSIIILSASFSPLLQEEFVSSNLVGLEKPIAGAVLMEAIDQLAAPVASCSYTLEQQTDARSLSGMSALSPAFV